MPTNQKHFQELLGTSIGTVLGFFKAWDLSRFADELHTIELAALGAATGFFVSTALKWMKRKISK